MLLASIQNLLDYLTLWTTCERLHLVMYIISLMPQPFYHTRSDSRSTPIFPPVL